MVSACCVAKSKLSSIRPCLIHILSDGKRSWKGQQGIGCHMCFTLQIRHTKLLPFPDIVVRQCLVIAVLHPLARGVSQAQVRVFRNLPGAHSNLEWIYGYCKITLPFTYSTQDIKVYYFSSYQSRHWHWLVQIFRRQGIPTLLTSVSR